MRISHCTTKVLHYNMLRPDSVKKLKAARVHPVESVGSAFWVKTDRQAGIDLEMFLAETRLDSPFDQNS